MTINNQIPRIRIEPPRTGTDGTGAAMLMQAYGVTLDEWQKLCLSAWLGRDQTGNYNVTSAGLSVPRQNGKSEVLIARSFYGLVVNGESVLYSSNLLRGVKLVFRRLVSMFTDKRHPEIQNLVKQIRYGIGEESIELHNGGRIQFMSRSRQAARGFDGISLVILDEAAEVTDDQMEAIMAVLSASTTGIRQILYVGTPPYPGCPGEVFRRFRQACLMSSGKGENMSNCWHEWSVAADNVQDIDLSNHDLWIECNPALPGRLTMEFTEEEFKTLGPGGFARERLGYWSQPTVTHTELAIDPKIWNSCRSDEERPAEGRTAYGVKFSSDGSEVVLAGAIVPSSGGPARITLLAVEPMGRGLSWLADWLNERYKKAACAVIDGKNGSDILIDKMKDTWKFKDSIVKPSAQNVVTAANLLLNELTEKTVTWYSQQEELKESALTATKRSISGGWGFGGQTSGPIEAASLALWGCRTAKRDPTRQMRIG